jgi:hypothetical protein
MPPSIDAQDHSGGGPVQSAGSCLLPQLKTDLAATDLAATEADIQCALQHLLPCQSADAVVVAGAVLYAGLRS